MNLPIEIKISRAIIGVICISMLCVCIVFAIVLVKMRGTLVESHIEKHRTRFFYVNDRANQRENYGYCEVQGRPC